MNRIAIALSLAFFLSSTVQAELKIPYLIGEGMVVQRGESIPIWGWNKPETQVVVEFDGNKKTAVSNGQGEWRVDFPAYSAGGPYIVSISDDSASVVFQDVWVGDVWVLSGQSNMEWPLRNVNNAEEEVLQASDSNIRHFKVPRSWSSEPENRLAGGEWQSASPETAGEFSGVGYFFAKSLREKVKIPLGLVNSTWGGSNIESWMDAPLLGLSRAEARLHIESLTESEKLMTADARENVSQWPDALVDKVEQATADWSGVSVDESDWVEIKAPMLWEESGFRGLDGVAWYRKAFVLSKQEANRDLVLGLAKIDDNDVTWVNGVKVGETNAYDRVRRYEVQAEHLQPGKNVIAIRVEDTGGGGGIYSGPSLLFIETEGVQRSLVGDWKFKVDRGVVSASDNRNHTATALYNKMMYPLFKIPVKGVLWYQGESNANNPDQAFVYRTQFKSLIMDWRKSWGNKDLPFLWVQLANFESGTNVEGQSPWAIVRESQTAALALPHTGQAITIDVGNPKDIHPRDKQTVGHRLALEALNKVYGKKKIKYRGPVLKKYKVKKDKVILVMRANKTLKVSGESESVVEGFEVAGEDNQFYPANVQLKGKKVIVWSESVEHPVHVRYAWNDNPENANLVDALGFPAEPFRTNKP